MWLLVENGTNRIAAAFPGDRQPSGCDLSAARFVRAPEQTVELVSGSADGTLTIHELHYPDDVVVYTKEEFTALIDRDTDAAIREAVHPFAPTGEQFAILRNDLVRVLNALGLEASPELTRWNEIAIAEIEKGRAEKGLAPDGEKTTRLDPSSGLLSKLIAIAAKKG